MIRAALALVLIAALIVAVTALMGEPGRATIEWLGWRLDMTAAAAVLLIAAGGLVSAVFWKLIGIAIEAPRRAAKARSEHRRQQGLELITRGFVAVEAGEGGEARRCALKAAELVDEAQDLVRVLAAQAAEAQGDQTAAETAYAAMLGAPRLSVAGYRGLMRLAANRGDEEAAQRYAEAAYGMARGAQWAWKSLLDARLAQGDWPGALALLRGAVERKIVTPVVADRTRAALLTACAATAEPGAAKVSDQAVEAARLRSDFTPAAAIAARRLQADGRTEKASSIIEAAWRAAPHPALWLAYRDLVANETPRERAERLGRLAALDPGHRESRMLQVEQMLIAGESDAIREAASALADEPATTRLCSLMARAAKATNDEDAARAWAIRAAEAPGEPDWSDIRPDGAAFPYSTVDWARVISVYAETGELAHPRFERGDPVISDLPDVPRGYRASAPFVRAAELGDAPRPDDPGPSAPDLAPAAGPST